MKRMMMITAMALLVIGCGKSGKGSDRTAGEPATAVTKESSTTSNVDRKSDEYIISRVQSIYDDVFALYYKADEDESTPQNTPDEKYCSDDWNKVLQQVTEYDQQNNPDDIGFFDADYWVMGQDFGELAVSGLLLEKHDGNQAKVRFELHNFGKVIPVSIDLRYERGDWFIDNFYDIENDYDWKNGMRDYLNP